MTPLEKDIIEAVRTLGPAASSYNIWKALMEKNDSIWRPSLGALWVAFHHLEERGLLRSQWEWVERPDGRRRMRYFHIGAERKDGE